jgi:hypothetical protein
MNFKEPFSRFITMAMVRIKHIYKDKVTVGLYPYNRYLYFPVMSSSRGDTP